MKKFLSLGLIIALGIIMVGCSDSSNTIAYKIDQNLTRLTTVLDKTTEASNEDLIVEDLYSLSDNQNNASEEKDETATQQVVKRNTTPTQKIPFVTKATYPIPPVNRLPRNNEIKKDNINNEKQVITPNEENNTINKITTNEKQNLNEKQKITPPGKAPEVTRQIVTEDDALSKNIVQTSSLNINGKRLSSRRTSDTSRLTSNYYSPRRVSSVNYNNVAFNNYLGKVEDLYLMMNDAVCVNDDICACKNDILNCCDLLSILSKQLKSNEITLDDEQKNSCLTLLTELGKATNKATGSRNDVSNECKSLKTSTKNFTVKVDEISTGYVKLINCLDTRITNYENILNILQQLRCILTNECYSQVEIPNEQNIEDIYNQTNNAKENESVEKDILNSDTDQDNAKTILQNLMRGKQNDKIENNDKNNTTEKENVVVNTPTIQEEKDNKSLIQKDTEKTTPLLKNEQKTPDDKNIDTYKSQTVKPNVIAKKDKAQSQSNTNKTTESTDKQSNAKENDTKTDKKPTITPNIDSFGYNNGVVANSGVGAGDGVTNNSAVANGVNSGIGANGMGAGVGVNGAGVGAGIGVNGAGMGAGLGYGAGVGYGAGMGTNGYRIHNYENGITNPYRNTDTYKLPMAGTGANSGIGASAGMGYNGVVSISQPLPSETRRNFKPFI